MQGTYRADQDRRPAAFSRRRFVAALTLGGGGLLLAACGGGAPAPTAALPAAPTAPPTVVTATRAAGTPTAAAGAGTPAASPSAASPAARATPGAAPTALGQLLATVPLIPELPGQNGIWFVDDARQKRNYGFAGVTTFQAFQALPADRQQRFNTVVGGLPHTDTAGLQYAYKANWDKALGFSFWQVEQEISAGDPPNVWSRLAGAFDRAAIERALTGDGYRPVSFQGQTYLSHYDDFAVHPDDRIGKLTLSRFNRVYLQDRALETAAATATIEAGIAAATGGHPTFAGDPDYAALADALGPVVGAVLLKGDLLYRQAAPSPRGTPATPASPAGQPRLHPYRLVGLALLDDGKTQTALLALLYPDAAAAGADAPVLHRRVNDYQLHATRQPLRDRLAPGDPRVVPAGGRAVLVQPFGVADAANQNLLVEMLSRRDLAFLAG
ncbi:MAG TPA: hypothetical protein VFW96_23235 [Thermomicrobiales bacterium]|nr:hypothetical protein [Thermomicrobiales bacterium]